MWNFCFVFMHLYISILYILGNTANKSFISAMNKISKIQAPNTVVIYRKT